MISLMALVVMTMTSCMHVKVGGKDFSLGKNGGNDTPTQVHQVGQLTSMNVFDNVNVAGPFNVFYEQGDAFTVLVKGTVEQLEKMTIYVKDDGLYIDRRENKWSGNDFKGLQVFVTAPSIKGLGVAGSGTITAPEALTLENLGLEVAGSGSIILAQLTCADLNNEIAGGQVDPRHRSSRQHQERNRWLGRHRHGWLEVHRGEQRDCRFWLHRS